MLDLDNPLPLEEIYEQASNALTGLAPAHAREEPASTTTHRDRAAPPQPNISQADKTAAPLLGPAASLEMKHFGTELLTREAGMAIRAELATRLLTVEKVVVNLDGIADITPSVADEAFAKLAERVGQEKFQRLVIFEGGTTLIRRLIDFVIKTRVR